MALTEIVALLRTKSKIIYPVTQLKNITDDSEDLTAPADADSVPLVDASDSGQMKKITWANIKTALSSLFAAKSHTHYNNQISISSSANYSGGTFYTDRGFIDRAGANRLAFLPASAVKIEYSEDGGETWKDYGATDEQKRRLFDMNASGSVRVCKNASSTRAVTTNDMMRITVSPTDRYAQVDQAYIWLTTPGHGLRCDIEYSTIGAKTTFTKLRENVPVSGWSGPNTINFSAGAFGGGTSQTSNRYSYRFTFKIVSVSTSATYKYSSPLIYDLRMYGISVYSVANQMMKNGHLYSWDYDQNATFPASLEAEKFIGASASQSEAGLMSATDKVKLDGIATGANKYIHPSYTARSSGLYKITVDATGHISAVTAVTKEDITELGIPAQDTNTTYSNMTGASASAAGKAGLVPAPAAGAATRYLRSDGTWQVPPNTTYSLASFGITATAAELNKLDGVTATAAEINKLDGLTPTTAELNYVDGVTSNIQTQLNNKAAKTAATQSAAGLMSAADKKKLDGLSGDEVPVYIQESEPSENGCIWIKPK